MSLTEEEIIYAKSLLVHCDDPIPGYFEFLNKTWITFVEFGLNFTRYPNDYSFPLEMIKAIKMSDIFIVAFIAVLFTICRVLFCHIILKPCVNWLEIKTDDRFKFYESSWKFIVYLFFWLFEWYIVIYNGEYTLYHYPLRVWKDIHFTNAILYTDTPTDIYILYVMQLGFYIHSIYAVIRLDAWRTDSRMLIVHHFLTIFLLEFSFVMKYHKVGTLVLYLHDIADVLLEFTKCNVYLKNRDTGMTRINRFVSDIGYVSFISVWFYFRLYCFPLKVLHMTNWGAYITQIGRDPKMYLVFNVMLITLLMMNLYWFNIILKLAFKILTGQLKEVEDVRETEIDAKESGDSTAIKANPVSDPGQQQYLYDNKKFVNGVSFTAINGDCQLTTRNGTVDSQDDKVIS